MKNLLDTVIYGNFITVSNLMPFATAVGIKDGVIVEVGKAERFKKEDIKSSEVIDLSGRTIIPGFIDTHCHSVWSGMISESLSLRDAKSIDEVLSRIRKYADEKEVGSFLYATGFDYSTIKEDRMVTLDEFDQAAGQHPAMIQVFDCHSVFANSIMLNKMNLPDSKGYNKDKNGHPTGLIEDPAITMVYPKIIPTKEEEIVNAVMKFSKAAISEGITSIHCKEFPETINILEKNRKKIPIRFRSFVWFLPENLDNIDSFIRSWDNDKGLTIGIIADGAPDSKTAGLFSPYPDNPDNFGTVFYTEQQRRSFIEKVLLAGHQVSIHACGHRTLEIILNDIEAVLNKFPKKDHRIRIEHFETAFGSQIKRVAKLNIVLAMQPQHINISGHDDYSRYWLNTVGIENYKTYWLYRSILDEGIVISGGSDSPVVPTRPLTGIHWAVNNIINPEQSISVHEALKMFTLGGAFCGFEENLKGSIEKGKYADFAVLSDNPFSVPKENLKDIFVEKTILGGRILFDNFH